MRNEVLCLPPLIILVPYEDNTASLGSTGSKNESILPGCPRDAIHRGAQVLLEDAVVPIVVHVAFPHFDLPVVAASGNDAFILGVGPSHLPDGSLVCFNRCCCCILTTVGAYIADLQKAIAITASHLSAIVIELAIVDVVLMLSVQSEDCVGSGGLGCCLSWLLGMWCLGSPRHSTRVHHHVRLLLLLPTHHSVVVPCLPHFSFVSKMAKTH